MIKHTYIILAVIFASFFALGMPDGAFGVAWPFIRTDLYQPLEQAGIIMVVQSFFYALASSRLGRIARIAKLEKIGATGVIVIAVSFFGVSFAPNFTVLAIMFVPVGIGMGLVDASFNSYAVKSFSPRQINWLHCFWGLGASVTPMLMVQVITAATWRAGYLLIAAAQGAIALIVMASILKGVWAKTEKGAEISSQATHQKKYLTKKRHKFMAVACCFLYGGTEYAVGVWITSVLLESRGLALELVGLYPAVYYASITGGRLIFGFWANKFSNAAIIRFGFSLSLAGLALLFITGSILGMALIGLGFAPIFPALIHGTASRFDSKILTRIVGYQMAALGAGVAILASLIGQILSRVSLEALFPMIMVLVVLTLLLNELLEKVVKRVEGKIG